MSGDPGIQPAGSPDANGEEALRQLQQRLDRASEMAERLIVEAAAQVVGEESGSGPGGESGSGPSGESGSGPGGESGSGPGGDSGSGPGKRSGPGDAAAPGAGPPPTDPPKPPPAGWQRAEPRDRDGVADDVTDDAAGGAGGPAAPPGRGELDLLLALLHAVRDRIPPELQRRLVEAFREVLLALRAMIDWYLERTERRRNESADVEDIPIL